MEEDIEVDILGDFDLINNLAQLNKFKSVRKIKKEKRKSKLRQKLNRSYSMFEANEEVNISKHDLNEDVPVDVEGDEDKVKFEADLSEDIPVDVKSDEDKMNLDANLSENVPADVEDDEDMVKLDANVSEDSPVDVKSDEDKVKLGADLSEDVPIDVDNGDEDNESVQSIHSEEVLPVSRRSERRKERDESVERESSSDDEDDFDYEIPISELHSMISSATGFGDGAINIIHDEYSRVSRLSVNRYRKDAFNVSPKTNSKKRKLEEADEQKNFCKHFDSINLAPFRIMFRLEALIAAEIHAHSVRRTPGIGLLRGFYDEAQRTLHITNSIAYGVTGCQVLLKYKKHNRKSIVGWYFAYPLPTKDSYALNVPVHKDLKKLFTNSASDPFIMLALSPFNRIKTRCVTTVDDSPYLIDYEVNFFNDTNLEKAFRGISQGLCKGSFACHMAVISDFNDKTYGQLCFESVKRLLDSTVDRLSYEVKDQLMCKTKKEIDGDVSLTWRVYDSSASSVDSLELYDL